MPKHCVLARRLIHGCIKTLDNGARREPIKQRTVRGTMHAIAVALCLMRSARMSQKQVKLVVLERPLASLHSEAH